jgi:phosphomannomutase
MKKIALFDLDDTLSVSKQPIQEREAQAFATLLNTMKGGIVSGAKISQMESQVIAHLPEGTNLSNLYCFTQNAASCYLYKEGSFAPVYSFLFTEEESKEVLQALTDVLEETNLLEGEPSYGDRIEHRGSQITLSALGQSAPPEVKKVWDPDQKKRSMLRERLLPRIPNFDIGIGGGTSLDITKKGINKTYAISWLKEHEGIDIQDMVYVGDALFPGGNDAVVIPTGIPTVATKGPEETTLIIERILRGEL